MSQIKSRARVRDTGEVFTAPREVNAMLDLLPSDVFANLDSTFLEPTCGVGAFLVEVLRRKLRYCSVPLDVWRAVSSLYGIDIAADNVAETRAALRAVVLEATERWYTFIVVGEHMMRQVDEILEANVQQGDTLNCDVHGWQWGWPTNPGGFVEPVRRRTLIWKAAAGLKPKPAPEPVLDEQLSLFG